MTYPICALCFQRQVHVWYDGADMPIGPCCIGRALDEAEDQMLAEAVDMAYTIAIANEAWGTVEWLNERLHWT